MPETDPVLPVAAPGFRATGTIDVLLMLLAKVAQYGVPAVLELLIRLRSQTSQDPTVEEIFALVSGIKRPGEYTPSGT